MNRKILVDGAFKEETRVALLENDILEYYNREDSNFKQLRGNIYLAKIVRIEPSLQAAFVDYGGEKNGFLPFSDIHPDYYNISDEEKSDLKNIKFFQNEILNHNQNFNNIENNESIENDDENIGIINNNYSFEEEFDEILREEYKNFKIEEVIKEGQLILVQVQKEERGNKGVSLSTYISLAGKYCVLLPNNSNHSGISKKITDLNERKILKSILRSLNVSDTKSLILRTDAVDKKPESILKDYLYLLKLWNVIKKITIDSKNPTFIHSEDDIVKKTIRDIVTDNCEIIIEGKNIYNEIKNILDIIYDNQNLNIKLHNDKIPLFQKYNVESQLLDLYSNKVSLPSGGSIVIDQTEALISIDVNSGKYTKKNSIEEMALATNLEAAKEIARQLRLRDLGGIIVIDYIDMFEIKNKRLLEKTMKDLMMFDKARIQIARLSMFCLMELSRQRIGASYAEKTSEICPRCSGKGKIKSKEIVSLSILREIKYIVTIDKSINVITIEMNNELFTYMTNYLRNKIKEIEKNYNIYIFLFEDLSLEGNSYNIKKRKDLTTEEKEILFPREKLGKINMNFSENNLHSFNEEDIKQYNFEDVYKKNSIKKVKKQYNKKPNFNNYKKENWFKKLFKLN